MKLKVSHYICISLAITAILIPVAYNSLTQMKLDTSIHQIMGTDSRTKDTYDKFNKAFNNATTVIAIIKMDKIFSNEGAKTLYELSSTFQTIDGFKDIKSLTHSARPVKGKLSFDIRNMVTFKTFVDLKPKTDEEWQKLKEFTTAYPMTRDILVSADGSHALIIAVIEDKIVTIEQKKALLKNAKEKIKPFQNKGIQVNLLSEPFLAAEFHDLVYEFLTYFLSISLSLLAITIYLTFRSYKILILMISYQITGFLIFPPIFQLNLTSINVFTFIIIPLVSALHLTFLTHFFSVFQEYSTSENHIRSILKKTLKTVLKPSVIALITSGIGLGSLGFSNIEALKTVGIVGLEALLGIFAITFIPAILLSLGKTEESEENEKEPAPETKLFNFISKYKTPVLISSLAMALTVGLLVPKLDTDVRIKEFLINESETRLALNILDEHFGGINILQLKVQTDKENGIQEYSTVTYLHNLRNEAMKLDGVLNAYTYSQFYTTIHQLFLGDDLSTGNVLPDPGKAMIYSKLFNSIHFPFQEILQSENKQSTVFFLRTRDLPTKDFLKVVDEFAILAKQNKPPGVEVQVQAGVHTILKSNQEIVKTQVKSLGTSLLAIFICLLFMWRSIKLAVAALICNLVPLTFIGGLMLIFGIPINSITVMAGSIILGISVDDSIHFLSYFKNSSKNRKLKEAIQLTLSHKLKPMICTSLILIICLSLLLLAPFTPVKDFGFLGSFSLLGGLASSCILLPGLLLIMKKSEN